MLGEEVGRQKEVKSFGVHHIEPVSNAPRPHRQANLAAPTTVHHMAIPHANGSGRRDVLQVPRS